MDLGRNMQDLTLILAMASLMVLLNPIVENQNSVKAAPISALPNFNNCKELVTTYNESSTVVKNISWNCCLKPVSNMIEFSFASLQNDQDQNQQPNSTIPKSKKAKAKIKVRKAAHKMSPREIARYRKAYELMKALPADDPRSFHAQANIHCAFCEGIYRHRSDGFPLQMHFNWLFLPWHRMYLYFHERILQGLLGDDSFSLAFWNWDDQIYGGNVIPPMFAEQGSSIYDDKRDPDSLPPAIVKLHSKFNSSNKSVLVQENLNVMYQAVVTQRSANLFMGGPYRLGMDLSNFTFTNAPLGGTLENGPHDAVHFWAGDSRQPLRQDMTAFATTARDPLFYAHHTNIDRLWEVWRYNMPDGHRSVHYDLDFLDSEFFFYDENANLVKVKVKDTLDTSKLGYTYAYAQGDDAWIYHNPVVLSNKSSHETNSSSHYVANHGNFVINNKLTVMVKRQHYSESKANNQTLEVLSIGGIGIEGNGFGFGNQVGRMLVFVNLVDADEATSTNCAEYVGTMTFLPSLFRSKTKMNVKFEIGDNLQRIGYHKENDLVAVTLVALDITKVTIQTLQIAFE